MVMNWLHLLNESNIYKKTALLVGSFLDKKSKAIGLLKWSIFIGKFFSKNTIIFFYNLRIVMNWL